MCSFQFKRYLLCYKSQVLTLAACTLATLSKGALLRASVKAINLKREYRS
jgi:hypothetical protein